MPQERADGWAPAWRTLRQHGRRLGRARFPRSLADTLSRTGLATWGAVLVLASSSVLYHLPRLVGGIVPTQDDVEYFYFPLLVETAEALRQGQVRLWSPFIFSGYPVFADGEAGMLYPLNLLTLPWMRPEQALVALPVLHSALAALFTFWLVRALGGSRLGGVVGGLTYAYCGFAAGQSVHFNVMRSLVWLPLELMLAERMCAARGRRRLGAAALLGGVFGIQALALHVHITLLSALVVCLFVVHRWVDPVASRIRRARKPSPAAADSPRAGAGEGIEPVAPPRQRDYGRLGHVAGGNEDGGWRAWLGEGAALGACLGLVGALGVGIGAVQLFPLLELAEHSYRGGGLSAAASAANSVWPGNLATLLLPHLFDVGTRDYWGPWVKWETVLYVGVLPLALALCGVLVSRGRYRGFFAGCMGLSLLAAMGAYAPLPLWDWLHALPGFTVLKGPGRFSLLWSLGVALTAAYGADWLRQRRPSPRWAGAIAVMGLAVVGGGALALQVLAERVDRWASVGSVLFERYLTLPGVPQSVDGAPLTMQRAAELAASALSPANPATAWQLGLVLATALCVGLWWLGAWARPLASAATVALLFADLWMLGLTFHPFIRIADLRPQLPAVLEQAAPGQARLLTVPLTVREKTSPLDPNRLLPAGVEEAGGYSSLPPDRLASYLSYALQGDDGLLNAWSVRYLSRQNQPELLPDARGVSFHPTRPLFRGKIGHQDRLVLAPEGGRVEADELRLVAGLVEGGQVRQDAEVGRLTVRVANGPAQVLPLLAGRQVADVALEAPGAGPFAHGPVEAVAFRFQRTDPRADHYGETLWYAALPLPARTPIEAVEVEQTITQARLFIFGLGAYDDRSGEVTQVWVRPDRPLVYRDPAVTIRENLGALPRARLVAQATVLPAGSDVLLRMHQGPYDPRTMVLLEGPLPPGLVLPSAGGHPSSAGRASLTEYSPERVVVQTDAPQPAVLVLADAFFPGWTARVDGQPTPVLRADSMFRAVVAPAGQHTVVFTYQPLSVALGLIVTLGSCLAAAGLSLAAGRGR